MGTCVQSTKMSLGGNKNELACVYAALILHDDGAEVTGENIAKLVKAANVEIDPYWPTLFAKLCAGKNLGDMISSVGAAPAAGGAAAGGAAAGGAAAAADAPAAAAAAKEEEEEEDDEDMGFGLFD